MKIRKNTAAALNRLDQEGITCYIHYIAKKRYELIINFEIVKQYRQRRSCNRYIEKLADKKIANGK